MALGGGTYLVQNKVLPGAYINFVSKPRAMGAIGERGTVCVGMAMDWGPEGMMEIEAVDFQRGLMGLLGYEYTHEKLKDFRELFIGAKTAKIFRLNGGTQATATIGKLAVKAKYSGLRGNDLKIVVLENVDEVGAFDVQTYLETTLVDTQTVQVAEELEDNAYIIFSGTGVLSASVATALSGGASAEVTGNDYSRFLAQAENEEFQVLAYAGEDAITKKLFVNFTKRLRDEDGVKFVLVLFDYAVADYEGVISVATAKELVYWTAGKSAGAEMNESLTNCLYDGEYEIVAKESKSGFTKKLQAGEFVFYMDGTELRVLRDINSFTSFETAKNSDFSSNRVVRVLDGIGNDIARIFSKNYLGKQSNNANGRNLLKAEIIAYHEQLMGIEAVENFMAEDISIVQGTEKQDVVVYVSVQPTDAMEKLYMQVEVV